MRLVLISDFLLIKRRPYKQTAVYAVWGWKFEQNAVWAINRSIGRGIIVDSAHQKHSFRNFLQISFEIKM